MNKKQLFSILMLLPFMVAGLLCQEKQPAKPQPKQQTQQATDKKEETPQEPIQVTAQIEVGAQGRFVDGEKTWYFQVYRDIPQGAILRTFNFSVFRPGSPRSFTFVSTDLIQRDQRFVARFEDVGRHRLELYWTSLPRYWSNRNPMVPNEVSRGVFTVPAGLRASLENATGSELIRLAEDAVFSSRQIEIRSFRNRGTLAYTYGLSDNFSVNLAYTMDRRSGNRYFNQGTYSRIPTELGDVFETPGQELYEPTSYLTNQVDAGFDYTRKNWTVGFDYTGSFFDNHTESLIWQNPFRLTPAQATLPAGALLRGRFAVSQAALPPDNQAHTFTFRGLILLPRTSKASALISWSRYLQDEPFLPFTLNTAITAGNLPPGITPTSLAALPRRSLDGEIDIFNQDYVASTRLVRWLQLTARYNDYDLDNDTEEILFPGYAGFGDSFWRTSISGQPGTTPLPVQNEPKSFRRQRVYLEGALHANRDFTWKAAYRYERYSRVRRQVPLAHEHGLLTSISYSPKRSVFLQAGFRYFDRNPDFYDPGTLEPPFLRMFDQTDRLRKQGDAMLSFTPGSKTTFSASWFYLADTYSKTFFGLHQQKSFSVATDISHNWRSALGLVAGFGYDRTGYDYLAIAKTATPYDFQNTWARDTRDGVYYVRFGAAGDFAEGKANYELNYETGLARILINTVNIGTPVPTNITNAQAFPFPKVKYQIHELRFDASYEINEQLRIGLFYLLEPFRMNNFSRDFIEPYAPQLIAPENDATRYMFLDVGPTNFIGHALAFYVRYGLFRKGR